MNVRQNKVARVPACRSERHNGSLDPHQRAKNPEGEVDNNDFLSLELSFAPESAHLRCSRRRRTFRLEFDRQASR